MPNPCTQDCTDRYGGCVRDCPRYQAYKAETAARQAERDRDTRRRQDYADYKRDAIQRARGNGYRRRGERIESR